MRFNRLLSNINFCVEGGDYYAIKNRKVIDNKRRTIDKQQANNRRTEYKNNELHIQTTDKLQTNND